MVTGTLISTLPIATPNSPPLLPRIPLRRFVCRSSQGNDGAAGNFRYDGGGGGGDVFRGRERRNWWTDEPDVGFDADDEFGGFDYEPESVLDKIWIFKVLKSYGYLLPAIIASMLLTSGPKAFLMALALPLGQSALSLAFEKVWGKSRERPMPRSKTKRRPSNRSSSGVSWQEDEKSESTTTTTRVNEAKQEYQSWVASGGGRAEKGKTRGGSFGGWDELDVNRRQYRRNTSGKQSSRATSEDSAPIDRGRLSKKSKRKNTPFLVRLLIAVFPFLGSWTKML